MNDADRVANAARMLVEAAGMRTAEENIRFLNDQLVELSDRVTNDSRQFEMDIESLRRQHDALDKRVVLLSEQADGDALHIGARFADLAERLTTLEHRVVLDGLNPPAPEPDDDPLDLDACGPGTITEVTFETRVDESMGWVGFDVPDDAIPDHFTDKAVVVTVRVKEADDE